MCRKKPIAKAMAFVRALNQAGMSAITNVRKSPRSTTPKCGSSVVNG
jgi:hypothetical protein